MDRLELLQEVVFEKIFLFTNLVSNVAWECYQLPKCGVVLLTDIKEYVID